MAQIAQEQSDALAQLATTPAALTTTPILQGEGPGETLEATLAGEGTTVDLSMDTASIPTIQTPTATPDSGQVATTATSLPDLEARTFAGATSQFNLNND